VRHALTQRLAGEQTLLVRDQAGRWGRRLFAVGRRAREVLLDFFMI
jgi:hypothetical protein